MGDIKRHQRYERSQYKTLDPAETFHDYACREDDEEWPCSAIREYWRIQNEEAE